MATKNTSKVEQWDVVAPATIEVEVGAGRARVDIRPGDPLPDTLTDEDRNALLQRGAIRKRADDSDVDSVQAQDGAAVVRPVPGVVEPDEIPRDLIPGGSVKDIMAWVGDDLARARVARDMEEAKGPKARATLLKALDDVKVSVETEPPTVPESYDGTIQPAPVGGVVTPVDDSAVQGKTADKAPATRNR